LNELCGMKENLPTWANPFWPNEATRFILKEIKVMIHHVQHARPQLSLDNRAAPSDPADLWYHNTGAGQESRAPLSCCDPLYWPHRKRGLQIFVARVLGVHNHLWRPKSDKSFTISCWSDIANCFEPKTGLPSELNACPRFSASLLESSGPTGIRAPKLEIARSKRALRARRTRMTSICASAIRLASSSD